MNILKIINKQRLNLAKPVGNVLYSMLVAMLCAIVQLMIKQNEFGFLLALKSIGLIAVLVGSNVGLAGFIVHHISGSRYIPELLCSNSVKKNMLNGVVYIYLPSVLSILTPLLIIYFHMVNALLMPTYLVLNIIIGMVMMVVLRVFGKTEKSQKNSYVSNYLSALGGVFGFYIFPFAFYFCFLIVEKGLDTSSFIVLMDYLILSFFSVAVIPVVLLMYQKVELFIKAFIFFAYVVVYVHIIYVAVSPAKYIVQREREYEPSYYFPMAACEKIYQQTGMKYIVLDHESCYFRTFSPSNKPYESIPCIQCSPRRITSLQTVLLESKYQAIQINSIELGNGNDRLERLFDLTAEASNIENFAIVIKNPHEKMYIYSSDENWINNKSIFLPDKNLLRDIIAAIPPFNRGISADTKKVNGISLTELYVGPVSQHLLEAKHSLGHFSYTKTEGRCKKIIHNKNVYATPLDSSCSDNTLLYTNIEKLLTWFNDLFSFGSADSFMKMIQDNKINQFHHAKVKISNRTLDVYYLSTRLNGMPVFMAKVYPDKASIMILLPDGKMLLDKDTLVVRNFLNVIFGDGNRAFR